MSSVDISARYDVRIAFPTPSERGMFAKTEYHRRTFSGVIWMFNRITYDDGRVILLAVSQDGCMKGFNLGAASKM